jgi:hypothetical protein
MSGERCPLYAPPPPLRWGPGSTSAWGVGLKTAFNTDRRQFYADRIFFLDEHRYIPRSRLSTSLASGSIQSALKAKPRTPPVLVPLARSKE